MPATESLGPSLLSERGIAAFHLQHRGSSSAEELWFFPGRTAARMEAARAPRSLEKSQSCALENGSVCSVVIQANWPRQTAAVEVRQGKVRF